MTEHRGRASASMVSDGRDATVFLDAHVHVHSCFDRDRFLQACYRNLTSESSTRSNTAHGMIVLTETRAANVFESWAHSGREGRWRFHSTEEPFSLWARPDDQPGGFFVIKGRQVRTREGLEALAMGTTAPISDGLGFDESLRRACEAALLVAIPWGFGKWWFRRGRIVRQGVSGRSVLLADNGNRPGWLPKPALLKKQAERGKPALSGTDPLPFPSHEPRAGSFGSVLQLPFDEARPFSSVTEAVLARAATRPFGRRRGTLPFLADQVRLQVRALSRERP